MKPLEPGALAHGSLRVAFMVPKTESGPAGGCGRSKGVFDGVPAVPELPANQLERKEGCSLCGHVIES